jgi:uncharacterized protein YkwD
MEDRRNSMRFNLFVKVFVFELSVLFLSCASMQEVFDTIGNSVSEATSSMTNRQGNNTSSASSRNDPNRRADPDAANWDIVTLDTAANVDYLSPAEKDVILEMNKVRADPKKYAELYIQPILQYNWGGPFGANSYLAPGETVYTSTDEGKNGIQSCINDLSRRRSMSPLLPAQGLFLAARDHVNDTGPKGITGHTGSDGSSMEQRINRYGVWSRGAGENIDYGNNAGRDIVVQLLIDDGVQNRGHRNNILNQNFKYAGNAIGSHSSFTYLCVIDFANEFTNT